MNLLINFGCDLNVQDESGETALHWACDKNKLDSVILLIERGADPLHRNAKGKTPGEIANNEQIRLYLQQQVQKN